MLRWRWAAPILVYAASTLEMLIMISPFAAYFYGVYTPVFHALTQTTATAWLPQFFLPHLARTKSLLFQMLWYLGPILAVVGLVGFFVCAGQLYYGKFVRKTLVNQWVYRRVRHPQYLSLGMAGLGFLLMWPRFIILLTYVMMVGLYYVLARHEEETLRARFGAEYEQYLGRTAMFNLFRRPDSMKSWQPPSRRRALAAWLALVVISVGLAFLLRMEATTQLYAVRWESPNVTAVAFAPRTDEWMTNAMQTVLTAEPLRAALQQTPDGTFLMQIASGGSELRHLLIDLGMKAAAIHALPGLGQGDAFVISRVTPLEAGKSGRVDPFGLDAQREPLFIVRARGLMGGLDVQPLTPDQFYPYFARVVF